MTMLEHKERLLRKVKLNNNGSASVEWRDYFINQETGQHSHNDVEHPGSTNGEVMLIHEDLKAAMAPFSEHWMIFGEEVSEPKANYPFDGSLKGLDRTTVTSVTLSGGEPQTDADEERTSVAVHIQGTFKLKDGRVKNYCLPGIKMSAPGEKYKFASHVDQHLQALEAEAFAYIAGKCMPPAQQQIQYDETNALVEQEGDQKLLGEPVE